MGLTNKSETANWRRPIVQYKFSNMKCQSEIAKKVDTLKPDLWMGRKSEQDYYQNKRLYSIAFAILIHVLNSGNYYS